LPLQQKKTTEEPSFLSLMQQKKSEVEAKEKKLLEEKWNAQDNSKELTEEEVERLVRESVEKANKDSFRRKTMDMIEEDSIMQKEGQWKLTRKSSKQKLVRRVSWNMPVERKDEGLISDE